MTRTNCCSYVNPCYWLRLAGEMIGAGIVDGAAKSATDALQTAVTGGVTPPFPSTTLNYLEIIVERVAASVSRGLRDGLGTLPVPVTNLVARLQMMYPDLSPSNIHVREVDDVVFVEDVDGCSAFPPTPEQLRLQERQSSTPIYAIITKLAQRVGMVSKPPIPSYNSNLLCQPERILTVQEKTRLILEMYNRFYQRSFKINTATIWLFVALIALLENGLKGERYGSIIQIGSAALSLTTVIYQLTKAKTEWDRLLSEWRTQARSSGRNQRFGYFYTLSLFTFFTSSVLCFPCCYFTFSKYPNPSQPSLVASANITVYFSFAMTVLTTWVMWTLLKGNLTKALQQAYRAR